MRVCGWVVHARTQVMILHKIKKFRKSINFIEWEHSYMEMQVTHTHTHTHTHFIEWEHSYMEMQVKNLEGYPTLTLILTLT